MARCHQDSQQDAGVTFSMIIGVDACCLANKRGFGRFTRELLEALLAIDGENEYLFFTDAEAEETLPPNAKKIFVKTENSSVKAASAEGRRSLKDLWAMSRAVWRHKVDLFFFPAVYSYFPVFNRAKIIVTVHDLIADHHPELVFPNKKLKFFWKLKQNIAVRQAELILTVSDYSKRQIAEYFGLKNSRLRVISEGAREVFKVLPKNAAMKETLAHYGLKNNEKFLLYVGGISPHKNLAALIEAFAFINRKQPELKLVLVGDYKNDPFFSAYPSLKKQIGKLGLDDKIVFAGFVPDEDLARFYNAAELLVFPSLEEGFGLPAMEAMACGAAVAASNCSSLPEVLGAAGKFFDPRDAKNMAAVIEEILADDNLRNSMKETGLKRAETFQWKKAAAQTLAIFNELTGKQIEHKTILPETISNFRHF